jgi:hypothetical protein
MNTLDDCLVRSRQSGLQLHAFYGHELISATHGLPRFAMNGDHDTGHVRTRLELGTRAGGESRTGTAQYEGASSNANVYIVACDTSPTGVWPAINGQLERTVHALQIASTSRRRHGIETLSARSECTGTGIIPHIVHDPVNSYGELRLPAGDFDQNFPAAH